RIRNQWEALGTNDPYWAVLTFPEKKGGKWNQEEFFQTGICEIAEVLSKVDTLNIELNRSNALDFGCGVGRLSRALSTHFEKVIGIDISEAMLTEAKQVNCNYDNLIFIHNNEADLKIVADRSIDFLYSNIVLQHMPDKMQKKYIIEFCRIINNKGIIVFQTPSKAKIRNIKGIAHMFFGNRFLNVVRKFIYGKNNIMEIHTLPKKEVIQILNECKMTLVNVERYDCAGPAYESYRYYAVKN
ncbi:class I SAM-dependent methyltransferase, partial [candidate division KSB1 bacterium]